METAPPPPPPPDTTPPETSISGGPDATTTDTSASFAFASSEAGSSFECSLDGAGGPPAIRPRAYSGLAVGSHSFAVRARDAAGNTDATPAVAGLDDHQPPPPRHHPARDLDQRRPRSDDHRHLGQLRLRFQRGRFELRVQPRRRRVVGLRPTSELPGSFDRRSPLRGAGHTMPPATPTRRPAEADWTVTDASARHHPARDLDQRPGPPPRPRTPRPASPSTRARPARASSAASTASSGRPAPHRRATRVFRSAITLRGAGHRRRRQHRRDAGRGRLDRDRAAARHHPARHLDQRRPRCQHRRHLGQLLLRLQRGRLELRVQPRRRRLGRLRLAEGLHRPRGRRPQLLGPRHRRGRQHGPTPATRSWTITPPPDTTPPDTTISSGPPASTASTSGQFRLQRDRGRLQLRVQARHGRLGLMRLARRATPASRSDAHQFSVRATDAAGNTDQSPATQSWTITPPPDTTPPDTTISSGPPSSTASTSASFSFNATEAGSSFECKLDTGAWASCASPKGYTGLAVGSPPVLGPRHRRGRQHRPIACDSELDDHGSPTKRLRHGRRQRLGGSDLRLRRVAGVGGLPGRRLLREADPERDQGRLRAS